MDDDLRINGLTEEQALAELCDDYCRFARISELGGRLDYLCDRCTLAGVIVQAYQDQFNRHLADVVDSVRRELSDDS